MLQCSNSPLYGDAVRLLSIDVESDSISIHFPPGEDPSGIEYRTNAFQISELHEPFNFQIGKHRFSIFTDLAECFEDHSQLSEVIRTDARLQSLSPIYSPSISTLSKWFEALSKVQRAVAGSVEFYNDAASLLSKPGGLDSAMVVLKEGDGWRIMGEHSEESQQFVGFYHSLLDQMQKMDDTVYLASESLAEFQADSKTYYVASPIRSEKHELIGALIGLRTKHHRNGRRGVRFLEAHFAKLVADTMSSALIRREQEVEIATQQAILSLAFPENIAKELIKNPEVLEGRETEVSVLFADVRNYTSITEAVGCNLSHQFISDVMEDLTIIVNDHYGVVLDYFGDGLAAFWNAPLEQANHADLACEAGLLMKTASDNLSAKWSQALGTEVKIGVGVHTGFAMVGNSGTSLRLKYGPTGPAVNFASRIQDLTKHIDDGILISERTSELVSLQCSIRRVYRAEFKGIAGRNNVFQLQRYKLEESMLENSNLLEQAINAIDEDKIDIAFQLLSKLRNNTPRDSAIEFLLSKVTERASRENLHLSVSAAKSFQSRVRKRSRD